MLSEPQCLLLTAAFGRDGADAWQRWCASTDFDALSLAAQRLMPRIHERTGLDSARDGRIHGLYRRARYLNRMLLETLCELAPACTREGVAAVACGPVPAVLAGAPYPLDCLHLAVDERGLETVQAVLAGCGWSAERTHLPREALVRSLGFERGTLRLRLHCRPSGETPFWEAVVKVTWQDRALAVPTPAWQLLDAAAPPDGWWKVPGCERMHGALLAMATAPAGSDWSALAGAQHAPEVARLLDAVLAFAERLGVAHAPACRAAFGAWTGAREQAPGRATRFIREYRRVARRFRMAGERRGPVSFAREFARLHWREDDVGSVLSRRMAGG